MHKLMQLADKRKHTHKPKTSQSAEILVVWTVRKAVITIDNNNRSGKSNTTSEGRGRKTVIVILAVTPMLK